MAENHIEAMDLDDHEAALLADALNGHRDEMEQDGSAFWLQWQDSLETKLRAAGLIETWYIAGLDRKEKP